MADASVAWCLGQNSGVSMAAAYLDPKVAHELFGDARAAVATGAPSAGRQGDRHRRRLSRDRALAVRQRQPPFAMARRPRHRLRAGRQPAARAERQAARTAHDVLPEIEGDHHRHLAGDRTARHRQRRLRGQRPVRAGGLQLHARVRRRPARDRAALSLLDLQHVRHGVLRRRARHRAHRAQRLHRARQEQEGAFVGQAAGREQPGPDPGRARRRRGSARRAPMCSTATRSSTSRRRPARRSATRSASPAAA